MLRSFALGFAAVACAAVAAALVGSTACLSAPPPDLPVPALQRPIILRGAVQPPAGPILGSFPQEFVVPVLLQSPDEPFQYDAFVDFAQCVGFSCGSGTTPYIPPTTVTPTPGTLDGGVYLAHFDPPAGVDPSSCHTIEFDVAHAFDTNLPHTPDSIGGDSVSWIYSPTGNLTGCTLYDAGSLQDGAFPPSDAASDGLPVTPQDGGGDP
ncbi:MAG TPA: hypothetical protein VGG39_03405 [Polyangiaceae bacterium]|jgi:hypothetical protein